MNKNLLKNNILGLQEDGDSEQQSLTNEDKISYGLGIDLGTTNTLASIVSSVDDDIKLLPLIDNKPMLPSLVSLKLELKSGNIEENIGFSSLQYDDPANEYLTIKSFKRLMGKNFSELIANPELMHQFAEFDQSIANIPHIRLGKQYYSSIELSAKILEKIQEKALELTEQNIEYAVITIPAYFSEHARKATKEAGMLAGLKNLRLLSEPTAAAMAYGVGSADSKLADGVYLVYDLGGGTFDISLIRYFKGFFQVVATKGDTLLGGDDFDQALRELILQKYPHLPDNIKEKLTPLALRYIRQELSGVSMISLNQWLEDSSLKNPESQNDYQITRVELENACLPIFHKTLKIIESVHIDSETPKEDLKALILVGGMTKMPLIVNELSRIYGKEKILNHLNPDEVVAIGAGILCKQVLSGSAFKLLLDVNPISIGIEVAGGLYERLLERNTPLPAEAQKVFSTQTDGQSTIKIAIYQGEREFVKDNALLSTFILKEIPLLPAGVPRILISFTMDQDGILKVIAYYLDPNGSPIILKKVEINNQLNVRENNIKKVLQESTEVQKPDLAQRIILEKKMKVAKLFDLAKKVLLTYKSLPNSKELVANNLILSEFNVAYKSLKKAYKTELKQPEQVIELSNKLDNLSDSLLNNMTKVQAFINQNSRGKSR